MRAHSLAGPVIDLLSEHPDRWFADRAAWNAHLDRLGISALKVHPDPVRIATEGALWGSVKAHGFLPDTVIVSDDAGQFNVGQHGLCWIHDERLVHKLDAFTDAQRAAQRRIRGLIWLLYANLKAWRRHPSAERKAVLSARFDRIFGHKTGFATLDRLLTRQRANKSELLKVLERPDIPLHTNGSENDVRCQVTKRKISGGTRADVGRDCRDGFLGLLKTCGKNGIEFWDYLGAASKSPVAGTSPPSPKSSPPGLPDRHDRIGNHSQCPHAAVDEVADRGVSAHSRALQEGRPQPALANARAFAPLAIFRLKPLKSLKTAKESRSRWCSISPNPACGEVEREIFHLASP